MNNKFLISIGLGILAIIISVLALACVIPNKNLAFDYMGVIITVLAILVTILVGWQVLQVIDFKRDLSIHKNDLEKSVSEKLKILDYKLSLIDIEKRKANALFQGEIAQLYGALARGVFNKEYLFISHTIKAVLLWEDCEEYKNASANIQFLLSTIKIEDIKLRKYQIYSLKETLNKIKHPEKIINYSDIYELINSLDSNY